MRRKLGFAVVALGAAMALFPSGALAATDDTSITIQGGTLDYTTPFTAGDFPTTTLNGLPQLVTANVNPYIVNDATGSGSGWNLALSATQFTCTTSGTCGTTKFPAGSLRVAQLAVPSTDVGNLASLPIINPLSGLLGIDTAVGTTYKIIQSGALAGPLLGTGRWTFTPPVGGLAVTVPASTNPGTYTSTITSTLSSGP
jgi:hypothetical protein